MSVGARGVFNAAYEPLLFDVISVPFPECGHEQLTLDALEAACRDENPAAFIVEPLILGAVDADVSRMGAAGDEADLRNIARSIHCRRRS